MDKAKPDGRAETEVFQVVDDAGASGGDADARPAAAERRGEASQWSEDEWRAWNQWSWGRTGWSHFQWAPASAAGDLPWGQESGQRGADRPGEPSVVSNDSRGVDPWLSSDPWERGPTTSGRWNYGDRWWSSGWPTTSKGDFSEPPTWPGMQHYRLWRRAITRWDRNTDVALHRRAEKILKSMDWSLQEKFDHLSEETLSSDKYLGEMLGILDVYAGEREDSDKRRSVRAALYEGARKNEESLAQYACRREAQFQAAAQYVQLPDELKAYMLEEQANLSRQSAQNLRVLTEGRADYQRVRKALQVIDVDGESIMRPGKTAFYEADASAHSSLLTHADDAEESDDSDLSPELCEMIDNQDMDEEQVMSFLTLWESSGKKRSWSENKQLKAARKKDRRHFDDKDGRPERPVSRRRLPVSELKKITRCSNCGLRGHWREDCTRPYRSKAEREKGDGPSSHSSQHDKKGSLNAFVYLGDETAKGTSLSTFFGWGSFANEYFAIPAGHAIVDPGAAQDLIGLQHFEELEKRLKGVGLQVVELDEKPPAASGVGGSAKVLKTVLSPCILGGQPGLIRLIVIEGDVPHLLSIGLLEHAGSVIDTSTGEILFKRFGCKASMQRLPSGHRILDIADWKGGPFPVPDEVQKAFHLRPDAFNLVSPDAPRGYFGAERNRPDVERLVLETIGHESFQGWTTDLFGRPAVCTQCHDSDMSLRLSTPAFEFSHEGFPLRSSWIVSFFSDRRPPVVQELEFEAAWMSKHDPHELHYISNIEGSKSCSHHVLVSIFSAEAVARSVEASSRSPKLDSFRSRSSASDVSAQAESRDLRSSRRSELSLVQHDAEAAVPILRAGEHTYSYAERWDFSPSRGDKSDSRTSFHEVPAPSGVDCHRPEPIRPVEEVCSMLHQAQLPTLRSCSAEAPSREEGDKEGLLCCDLSDGPSGRPSAEPVRCILEQRSLGNGDAGGVGAPVRRDEEHDVVGHVSDAQPSDGGHASAGHDSTADAILDGTAASPATSAVGHECAESGGPGGSDAGSTDIGGAAGSGGALRHVRQRRGLGAGGRGCSKAVPVTLRVAPQCFTSIQADIGRHPENVELRSWFFCRLGRSSLKVIASEAVITSWCMFSVGGSLVLCFCSPSWSADFDLDDCSDFFETQLTRAQKKALVETVSTFLREQCERNGYNSRRDAACHHHDDSRTDHETIRQFFLSLHASGQLQSEAEEQEPGSQSRIEMEAGENEPLGRVNTEDQEKEVIASRADKARTARNKIEVGKIMGEQDSSINTSSPCGLSFSCPLSSPDLRRAFCHGETANGRGRLKIMELFSPPRVSLLAKEHDFETTTPPAFDQKSGWEFFDAKHRADFWHVLRTQAPDVVLMSPECRPFSTLMAVNEERMEPEVLKRLRARGMAMLQFSIQVAEYQLQAGRFFWLEQPGSASSWATFGVKWLLEQEGVIRVLWDQCMSGLQVSARGPSRKTTGCVTNHLGLAAVLSERQCDHQHVHVHLEHGLPHKAQHYPEELVRLILKGLSLPDRPTTCYSATGANFPVDDVEEDEDDAAEEDMSGDRASPATPGVVRRDQALNFEPLTPEQKKKVMQVHTNLGHISREQMLSLFKAAGAKHSVMQFVRDQFSCEQCDKQKRPLERRKAAVPRTFTFNRHVGADIFYLSFQGRTLAYLNVICQGTNFQQVHWIQEFHGGSPSSKNVWKAFVACWLRPFGIPEVVLTDGGSEFKDQFERHLEQLSCLQIISDAASPWQNGRVERHGGWLKEKAENELTSGSSLISSPQDLEELLISLTSCKNRWYHRGGYSPYQLVFGCNPNIPFDLLCDNSQDVAWQDVTADPYDQDTAGAEFARTQKVRQRARELCVQFSSKERVRLSGNQRMLKQTQWAIGQWVFVWRRATQSGGNGHLTRSRWVGPGVVVLQTGHTVFVSMRSRLWRRWVQN